MNKNGYRVLSMLLCAAVMISSINANAKETNERILDTRKYLGEVVYAGDSDGYKKREVIDRKNPHYGWKLGEFYVSGFTRVTGDDDNPIILKNAGNKVKLSFNLNQNIDKLNGEQQYKIDSDNDGYDEEFGIKKTDFGRGMLIVQKTDYQGKKEEPVPYENFLSGVNLNADTEVELCEEGDYEVALDYSIAIDKGFLDRVKFWKQYTYDYRIYFKFSVRNGNCMVYPFDAKTKSELANVSVTKNGFYLDFAKSRYLDVDIKKQILKEDSMGLVEDTRFNKPAADGELFTDEGVYTITATNKYTNQTTEKTIYVGDNNLLKAYVTDGAGWTLSEIKKQIDAGAIIDEDGHIFYENTSVSTSNELKQDNNQSNTMNETIRNGIQKAFDVVKSIFWVVAGAIIVLIICIMIKRKIKNAKEKKKDKKGVKNN